jgi:hypothetical protein
MIYTLNLTETVMKKLISAIALAIALPAAAMAQTARPSAMKMDCSEKMKSMHEGMGKMMMGGASASGAHTMSMPMPMPTMSMPKADQPKH